MTSYMQLVPHMAGDVAAERAVRPCFCNLRESGRNIREFCSRARQPEPKLVVLANFKVGVAIKTAGNGEEGAPDGDRACNQEVALQQKTAVRIWRRRATQVLPALSIRGNHHGIV